MEEQKHGKWSNRLEQIMNTWNIPNSFFSLLSKGETKGDTPLASPARRGYTPLDSPKGEKEIELMVSTAGCEFYEARSPDAIMRELRRGVAFK